LTVLPADVGFLDSVKNIDLSRNLLASLPREIAVLSAVTSVDLRNNRLCQVPSAISAWIAPRAKFSDWASSQTKDGSFNCSGTGVGILAREPAIDGVLSVRISGGKLFARMPNSIQVMEMLVGSMDGSRTVRIRGADLVAGMDLARWSPGTYWVRCHAANRTFAATFALVQ
jgi:hypothetical protein